MNTAVHKLFCWLQGPVVLVQHVVHLYVQSGAVMCWQGWLCWEIGTKQAAMRTYLPLVLC